jgi:cell division protein FtsB
MAITERVWGALTAIVKLEDKVTRQAAALRTQQARIEQLTERVIRLEAQLELLTGAALMRRLKGR